MLNLLYGAGWSQDGRAEMHDNCIMLSFSHDEIPTLSLSVSICLDELPAVTIVSLMDNNGIIDQEWQDDEIDVDEITEAARLTYEEMLEMSEEE